MKGFVHLVIFLLILSGEPCRGDAQTVPAALPTAPATPPQKVVPWVPPEGDQLVVEETLVQLRARAEKGDAGAQYKIGTMYYSGDGVPQDRIEAVKWFRMVAEHGDANIQFGLGVLYAQGKDVPKDSVEATKWLTKSAEQGNGDALRLLASEWGLLNLSQRKYAKRGEADLAEAVRLFRAVAEKGDGWAQNWLAEAYTEGVGVTKDRAAALGWWEKAAMNGVIAAQEKLAEAYFTGNGVTKNHTEALKWHRAATEQKCTDTSYELSERYFPSRPEEKVEASDFEKQSNDYLRKKAEGGDSKSQWTLGRSLADGRFGLAQDQVEAIKWIRKSAEQGVADAQFCLGLAYDLYVSTETGLERNDDEAVRWYRKAAEQGNTEAQFSLGRHCYSGQGTPQDFTEAAQWFRKAAEKSNIEAQVSFGLACAFGDGVSEDRVAAVKWLRKAAYRQNTHAQEALQTLLDNGNGVADEDAENVKRLLEAAGKGNGETEFQLYSVYSSGEGVIQDAKEATQWLRKAAERGHVEAQFDIALDYDFDSKGDKAEAAKWYRLAALQGHTQAQILLAQKYQQGAGVPQNYIEALAWYNVAAATGQKHALVGRDKLAYEIGSNGTLVAQQRSAEISKEIEAARADKTSAKSSGNGVALSEGGPKASGSGSIVSVRGHVLTAAHVVVGATRVAVVTSSGTRAAKILRIDEANDVAILKIDEGAFQPLPVAPSRRVRLGQGVATIGFPNVRIQGFSPKVTRGEISSLNGAGDDPRCWQISAPVQPGNSGGPLLDESGNLIGIIVSKLGAKAAAATGDTPQNVNYAVKSAYVLALLEPYLNSDAPEPNQAGSSQKFEDMVAKAQQSVVLILVY